MSEWNIKDGKAKRRVNYRLGASNRCNYSNDGERKNHNEQQWEGDDRTMVKDRTHSEQ